MNFEQARFNMVEQQVRPWDVLDPRVLNLMSKVYREDFVPLEFRKLAYADTSIPIGHGQIMLPPREEGRILQALQIQPSEHVLEIGTGSGYFTGLLAHQGFSVKSVDIFSELVASAKTRLERLELENISLQTGDASHEWDPGTQYDVICITASFYKLPENYKTQLKIGGRLFVFLGSEPAMQAALLTRYGQHEWRTEIIYETVVPAIINSELPPAFEF